MSIFSQFALRSRGFVPIFKNSAQQFIEQPGLRYKWQIRGLLPEKAKSLAVKRKERSYKDPEIYLDINIGFKFIPPTRRELMPERLKLHSMAKQNEELELAAKEKTLEVPLDQVYETWLDTQASTHIKESAIYFNIYSDLYGDAHFIPVVPLRINYDSADKLIPVCRGNIIRPTESSKKPQVDYSANEKDLYTLVMSTPDCHLTDENGEYLHWLVGNIPGKQVGKGEEICDYLQPFPPRGAGFCRYVYVLYKQDEKIDFSSHRRSLPCTNLGARTFSTYNFYSELQDVITPCGLAFFQADWDTNVTSVYHKILDMKEPVYEYDFAPLHVPEQKWFPHREPFNKYLDKFKEEKELQKELLIEKLKERHPFKPPPKKHKYPLAFRMSHDLPSWKNDEIRKKVMGEGKYKYM